MAYLESDRVAVRHFMGIGSSFLQAWPLLESALTSSQSIADGGTRPDSSAETAIKALVADMQTIELQLKTNWKAMMALTVDEVKVDYARAMAALRMEGRRLAFSLARYLDFNAVMGDVFSSRPPEIPRLYGAPDVFSRH